MAAITPRRKTSRRTFDCSYGHLISLEGLVRTSEFMKKYVVLLVLLAGISTGDEISQGSGGFKCLVGEVTCSSLVGESTPSTATNTALSGIDGEEEDLLQVCIQVDWVCDGHDDCPDGEDENNCSIESEIESQLRVPSRNSSDSKFPFSDSAERDPFGDWQPPSRASPPGPEMEAATSKSTFPESTTTRSTLSTQPSLRWADLRTLPPPPAPALRDLANNDISSASGFSMRKSTILIPTQPPAKLRPSWSNPSSDKIKDPGPVWLGPALVDPFRTPSTPLIPAVTAQEPILSYEEYKRRSTTMTTVTTVKSEATTTSPSSLWSTSTTKKPVTKPPFGGWSKTTPNSAFWMTTSSTPTTTSHYWWEAGRRNELAGQDLPLWMKRLMRDNSNGIENTTARPSETITSRIWTTTTTRAPPTTTTAGRLATGPSTTTVANFGREWRTSSFRTPTMAPSTMTTSRNKESSWSLRDWLNRKASTISASDVYYKGFDSKFTASTRTPTTPSPLSTETVSSNMGAVPSKRILGMDKKPSPALEDDLRGTVEELKRKLQRLEEQLRTAGSSTVLQPADDHEERIRRLEASSRAISPSSCEELARLGETASGWHYIDPDGPGLGVNPFRVYCEFDGSNGVSTVIHHGAKEASIPIQPCTEPGCVHKQKIQYEPSNEQIQAMKDISSGCSQEVAYSCRSAPLLENAWWIGNDGAVDRYYWSGSGHPDVHACACGIEIACVAPPQASSNVDLMCNCDANSTDLYTDEGVLTDTVALPVRELHFKGLTSSKQSANVTLGPLKCFGKKDFLPTGSCQSLRRAGHTRSGLYLIQPSESYLEVAECNMDLESSDSRLQRTLNARIHLNAVMFDAYRTTTMDSRGASSMIVPYENFTVSLGGGMELASGIFTATVPGVYSFSFHALDYSTSKAAIVHLRRNGEVLQVGYSYPANNRGTFGFQTLVELEKGDQVDTMVTGQLFSNSNRLVHFTGMLLRPGLS